MPFNVLKIPKNKEIINLAHYEKILEAKVIVL